MIIPFFGNLTLLKNSTILTVGLVASAILLAASILPAASALQTPRRGSYGDTVTFTVEGNSLAELREEVRQEVNDLPIPNAQRAAVVNDVMAQLAEEVPGDGTEVSVEITITIECTFPPLRCTITIEIEIDF
jgi:hypothetical protein